MIHDLVLRGGTVIDGTGGPPRTADVAIRGDRIVEIGRVEGAGRREIAAHGALVTPGFVDIHTHYDGQATWDSRLQPSSAHGVTTVVAGNCGVGFAPVRPSDREMLVALMEGVEDLPGAVLDEGLSWEWETFGEYLDFLDGRDFDVDLATQVCHAAVRVYVMGERGAKREAATDNEIAAMARICGEAVREGALGFSTSRTLNHRTSSGDPTPTLTAARAELVGIAQAIGETGRGVFQVVSDFTAEGEDDTLLQMMSASGRPLSFSLLQTSPGRSYGTRLQLLERANAHGLAMRAQVAARAVGVLAGLQSSVNPLVRCPGYRQFTDRALGEQVRALAEPGRRAELVAEARHLISPSSLQRIFPLGSPLNYEPTADDSVAAIATHEGADPIERYVDLLLADEGRALLYLPFLNYEDGNLDAAAEMLADPFTVPGLGDGGAHVGTICDASFPTTLLTLWGRDRTRGTTFDLPFLIHRQSRATAAAVGLQDRGLLCPGYKADVNVIDFDRLEPAVPRIVHDLPAGGKRLLQGARGYLHTIVSGIETYADGEPTGALPGRLVRGSKDGATG